MNMEAGSLLLAWVMPIAILAFWGLGFYVLILLIKALKIYIDKNS